MIRQRENDPMSKRPPYNGYHDYSKALGKLGNIVAETLFPANVSPCFPEWANTGKH